MNRLQEAMTAAELDDGAEGAVRKALEEIEPAAVETVDKALRCDLERQIEQAEQIKLQRQRDLDAALADAVEIVARQRTRLGRRVCSRNDGRAIRSIFELLRAMMPDNGVEADSDRSFQ
jgi:hypothetical protein